MATDGGLGTSVLTLATDGTQFFSGLDQAEKRNDALKKAFDTTAKSARGAGDDMGVFGKELGKNVSTTDMMSGGLKKLGGALLAAFSIGAVTAALKSYTDFTGKIADMSAKTGIGTEALQRLKYAAEQNGSSLEQVSGAVTKLGNNLAGGNKNAVSALDALGLSLSTVRSMEPDRAFTAIADAIAKVPDPMDRSKLAMDLFGKSGAELLPMMTGNLTETAAAADKLGIVMSDDAVQAGDKFGDTMASLTAVGQAVIAQVLTPMIPTLTAVALWLGENIPAAISGARGAFDFLIKKGLEAKLGFEEFVLSIVELGAKVPWLGEKLGATSARIGEMRASVQLSKDTIAAFDRQTEAAGGTMTKAAGTVAKLNLNYGENAEETKKAASAAAAHTAAVKKLVDSMGGAEAIKAANLWLEALPQIGGLTRLSKDEKVKLNAVMADALDAYTSLGTVAPAALQQVWIATANLAEPLGTIDELWKNLAFAVQPVKDQWTSNFVLIGQKFTELEQEMTLANLTGVQLRLAEIERARTTELASLAVLMSTHKAEYEQLVALVNAKYKQMTDTATGANRTIVDRAKDAGYATRAELEETAATAKRTYEEMLASGLFTIDELNRAHLAAEQAKATASGKRKDHEISAAETVLDSTVSIMNELGKKHKAAAIAGAIISTYMAIAKSLAANPWPFNLVAAAAAGIAGWAQVNAIRNSDPGFKSGTPGLDFMDFGQASQTVLHGQEAVIPRGGGHQLAGEIARSLHGEMGGAGLMAEVQGLRSEMRGVRDDLNRRLVEAFRIAALDIAAAGR
jgi:hypothetical protein